MQDFVQLTAVRGHSGTTTAGTSPTQVFRQQGSRSDSEPTSLPLSAGRQAQGRLSNERRATLEESTRNKLEEVRRDLASVESFVGFLDDSAQQFRVELTLEAFRLVAVLFEERGKYVEAIRWLEKAYRKLKGRQLDEKAEIEASIGVCWAKKGEPARAASSLRRSLRRLFRSPEIHSNLGATYLRRGNPKKALLHLEQALHLNPQYAPAALNKALALEKMQRKQEAHDILNDMVKPGSTYDCSAEGRARALALLGRADEAIDTFETEARCAPANFLVLLLLARLSDSQGRLHASAGWFERALHINQDSEVLKEYEDIRARIDRESRLSAYVDAAEVEVPVGVAADDWSELASFLEGQT